MKEGGMPRRKNAETAVYFSIVTHLFSGNVDSQPTMARRVPEEPNILPEQHRNLAAANTLLEYACPDTPEVSPDGLPTIR
jgi:hypothetical protein